MIPSSISASLQDRHRLPHARGARIAHGIAWYDEAQSLKKREHARGCKWLPGVSLVERRCGLSMGGASTRSTACVLPATGQTLPYQRDKFPPPLSFVYGSRSQRLQPYRNASASAPHRTPEDASTGNRKLGLGVEKMQTTELGREAHLIAPP